MLSKLNILPSKHNVINGKSNAYITLLSANQIIIGFTLDHLVFTIFRLIYCSILRFLKFFLVCSSLMIHYLLYSVNCIKILSISISNSISISIRVLYCYIFLHHLNLPLNISYTLNQDLVYILQVFQSYFLDFRYATFTNKFICKT